MQDRPSFVGVDVSKAVLDVAVGVDGPVRRVANTPAGHRQLITELTRFEPVRIVLESTGGYSVPITSPDRDEFINQATIAIRACITEFAHLVPVPSDPTFRRLREQKAETIALLRAFELWQRRGQPSSQDE